MKMRIGVTLRITLVFVLLAASLQIILGVLSYRSGRDALEAAAVSELLSSALEKEAQINKLAARWESGILAIAGSASLLGMLEKRQQGAPPGAADAPPLPARENSSEFIMLAIADPGTGRLIARNAA